MREIRFRGRDLENGQPWRYGSLIQYPTGECAIVVTDSDVKELSYDVDPDTVGQDTGLDDIQGKDIYEDDILEISASYWEGRYLKDRIPCTVQWYPAATRFEMVNAKVMFSIPLLDIKIVDYHAIVIGNIHDNPKLMKGGHQ